MSAISSEQLEQLRSRHRDYSPNPEVCHQIGGITLITVSAPSGMGKNSIMRATGFNVVQGFTTRPMRDEEQGISSYNFFNDEPNVYARLLGEVKRGELLQYGVGIEDYVYGSYPDEYLPADGSAVTITDNSSTGAIRMRPLPFDTHHNTYLVAPFEQWWSRFDRSRTQRMNNQKRTQARIQEARHSIGVALEDGQFYFIENCDGKLHAASKKIVSLAAGHEIPTSHAKKQAERLYRDINDRLL